MKYNWIISFCCSALIIGGFTLLVSGQSRKTLAIPSTENCPQHLTWKIGKVVPRFSIDDKTIKSLMADVGKIWSRAAGKQLIAHNDSGEVAINFIYTEEQKTTDNEQQLLKRINRLKLKHLTLEQDYEQLFYEHQKKLTD